MAEMQKTITVPKNKVGKVIGPKGATIKSLMRTPRVRIDFNTRNPSSDGSVTMKIRGPPSSVIAVYKAVDDLVNVNTSDSTDIMRAFFDFGETDLRSKCMTLLEQKSSSKVVSGLNSAVKRHPVVLEIDSLSENEMIGNISLHDDVDDDKAPFQEFSKSAVQDLFDEALKMKISSTLEFNFSLGKMLFCAGGSNTVARLSTSKKGSISQKTLDNLQLRPVWITTLTTELTDKLTKCLEGDGFECLNASNPESFTIIHLHAGPERLFASVVLALDKELNAVPLADDDRLNETKREAVESILKAKRIGDIIPEGKSIKVTFRKLSLQVHPDKNSHRGATEAFKKLNDAYDKLSKGCPGSTKALEVETPKHSKNPPKVVSVTTNKKKLGTVSLISLNDLDIRAYVKTFDKEESGDNLSERIRRILNDCWEQRDADGGIADPGWGSGVQIKLVKQVTSKLYYGKEVTIDGRKEVLEVAVNVMRAKPYNGEWQNTLEIDVSVGEKTFTDGDVSNLIDKFLFVRGWCKNLKL